MVSPISLLTSAIQHVFTVRPVLLLTHSVICLYVSMSSFYSIVIVPLDQWILPLT